MIKYILQILITIVLVILFLFGCSRNDGKSNNSSQDTVESGTTVSRLSYSDSLDLTHIEVDWSRVLIAWREYLNNPSEINGDTLYSLIPRNSWFRNDSAYNNAFYIMYSHLYVIDSLVHLQNRMAVKIGFKLFNISDGAFSEDLDQMLGSLICKNPQMFLEELNSRKNITSRFDALLGNLGEEYRVNKDSEQAELKRRIEALNTVKPKNLVNLRDRCILELKNQLDEYK